MLEAIQNLKSEIQNLTGGHYVIEEPETNPNKVSGHTTGSAGPATPTGSAGHEARHIMAFSRLMNFTVGATRKPTKDIGEHASDDGNALENIGNVGIVDITADPEPIDTEWVEPASNSTPFIETQWEKAYRGMSACISIFNKKGTNFVVKSFEATGTNSVGKVVIDEALLDASTNTFSYMTRTILNNPIKYNSVELADLGNSTFHWIRVGLPD
ncbi:MAG: hypothetical protein IPJ30_12930 [Acidobacteria bacterium]|nr:hypothetical protein [Acidobacteriota bacterium]